MRKVCPRGFSLVELVVAAAATAILLAGLASAIVLASRALPENSGAAGASIVSNDLFERLSTELQQAIHITENTATAITFTVADRNGDGSPERIRYAWSGTPGQPLTRQYNNGTPATVLDNVQQFALGYDLKTVTESYPGPPVEGAELALNQYIGANSLKDFNIDKNNWTGQYFQPGVVLPVGTVSWRVTRVQFKAKNAGGASELTRVQLRPPNPDQTPASTILEEHMLDEAGLPGSYSLSWTEVAFTGVAGLSPSQGLCLVLEHDGAGVSATIRYDNNGGSGQLSTNNAGSTWNSNSPGAMQYNVYGKLTTLAPNQSVTRQYVTGVHITLQAGADADARTDTGVRALNAPELLSAVWELDFSTNPTTLDMNADGVADWVRRDGLAFNPASLVSGVWHADAVLDSQPNNDFTQITTVDVRFRNTSIGGNGAVFAINADWAGGTFAPVLAYLQLQADGTQTLSVYRKQDDLTPVQLVSVSGLSSGFVDLRLLIDPGYNTVNVRANGTDKGTYTYSTFVPLGNSRVATLQASGSTAEFDSLSIRVGGSH